MENNYIKNGNNRVEYPCLTQGEGKKRVRRGREEGKHWIGRQMLRMAAVLWVMMELGTVSAMAQTPFYDYSGRYYIASAKDQNNYSYNPTNPANNYYLCPTENWYWFVAPNTYTSNDNGMPFLTTYKCRNSSANPVYTPANAVWIIEKYNNLDGKDYYTIKRECDGKYLTHNGQMNGSTSNAVNRMRVHLQEDFSDEALFSIDRNANNIIIGVKSVTTAYKYFTVNKGNKPYLQGNGNPESSIGHGDIPLGGIIGLYNANDVNGQWVLEELVVRPTITLNTSNNEVTMTAPHGTIYYTTNGNDPSFDSNGDPTEGTQSYSGAFTPAYGVTVIKAVAVDNGEVSNVAIRYVPVLFGADNARLIQNQANPWTPDSGPQDLHFYMIPGDLKDVGGVNVTKVNTTSLFRPTMEWYFLDAGVGSDNYTQYYYIVNKAEAGDKRLCYDPSSGGKGVYLDTYDSSNADAFKFSILESPTAGTYNIRPFALTNANTNTNRFINKSNGNDKSDNINLSKTASDAIARWKFVLPSELDREAPFTVFNTSTNPDVYYYFKIGNVNNSNYFIIPVDGNYATTSNSPSDERKMHWYFEEAEAAAADDWLTYYHIRNAITGDYLYFDGDSYTTSPCFKTSSTEPGDDDHYKFTWAKTAALTPNYYIVPKLMKDELLNSITTLRRNNGLVLGQTRGADTYAWTFNSSTSFHFGTPTITYRNDDHGYVITSTETSATLYYTTDDGITLTPSSGTLYENPIDVANWPDPTVTTLTIRAIAARATNGTDQSPEVSVTVNRVATPEIITTGETVEITCATSGATIYYVMGDDNTIPDPTTSSMPYTEPIVNAGGKYIKAFAVKEAWINSHVTECTQVVFTCATPVIRKTSPTTYIITCDFPSTGVTIRYNIGENHGEPEAPTTTSGTIYGGTALSFTESDLPFTVKAIAYANNYNPSAVATKTFTTTLELDSDDYYIIENRNDFIKFISMVNDDDDYASAKYKITATEDINVSDVDEITRLFAGELKSIAKSDGTFPALTGLSHAIFNTVNGGVVHNIMLKSISVGGSGNVGAICNEARGYTRIYNCGILPTTADFPNGSHSTVTATGVENCAGGIVGLLSDDSRVVNCFSYADVSSGGYAAGIVGNNTFASTAEVENVSGVDKYTHLRTMVVNCMFYGNVTSGSSIWPVYGGTKILNTGATAINNYNFYSVGCTFSSTLTDYNCSWPAQIDYLTRYEFHRSLLNSNRELCGWWVGAPNAPSTMSTTDVQDVPKDASLIAKWVLDPSIAPYPILKPFGKYTSPVNIDADADWRISANKWEGKKLGTLNVTVNPGSQHTVTQNPELEIVITDMDTLRGDYCYKKIQLPYYNTVFGNPNGATWAEKYGDNYGDYVVIGWKVSTSEGTAGTLTENWQTGYNFADRNCTAKDANRVFAQGGYYYVPNGVNNITITAQWAHAVYFDNTDHSYDRVNMSGAKPGTHFAPAGTRPTTLGNGKTVLTNNLKELANTAAYIGDNVYDYAVVLVGNHQYRHHEGDNGEDIGSSSSKKGFTVISSDFDFDEEPDHCLIWQLGKKYGRQSFCPIRFDFLPIVEIGLAMKEDGSTQYYSLGCYRPLGHFEVTETSLIRFGQFEFSNKNRTVYAPLILNAGIYEQYCKGTDNNAFNVADDKINYIILGGNVRMPSFTPGAHVNANANKPTRHCAVNVIGGSIDNLYLTGNYNDNVTPNTDNPHCYIDGCRIKHVAAAGKEGINGDVYFKINHSKIWEFYGGSTMDQSSGDNFKTVKGNIDVTIDSSIVVKYCGGPKFGDMVYDEANPANSKTITTRATGTTFTYYYGGGNGGTSYVQYDKTDVTGDYGVSTGTYNWNGTGNNQGHLNSYTPAAYRSGDNNYKADYDMEIVNTSAGTESGEAVCRTYFYAAQFSATNTGPISNTLTGCKVLKNFYGAGNLGGVYGDVTSELTDTKVDSLAFGGGFSASIPQVTIYNRDKTPPTIDIHTGIITPQLEGTKTTYTWTNETSLGGTSLSTNSPAVLNPNGDGINYFFTTISLQNLGTVSGNVTLTIKGSSVIGTEGEANTGNVYGGGDQSAVTHNTTVKLQGSAHVLGNVYGGGNRGLVSGNSSVTIEPEP